MILIGAGGHARDIQDAGGYEFEAVFGHHYLLPTPIPSDRYIIGVNDPHVREAIADELGVNDQPWVHPHAYVAASCSIGTGTHVNYGATMTRSTIGSHCTIAPGVTICGDVTIGDRVFVGAGATIRNLVTIGDDAFICMGAVVTRDVAAGEKYR